jgi:hypothetical protein
MRRPLREIIVAWAFCGVVGLGTLMFVSSGNLATAVYPGVHLPHHSASLATGLSIADQFAEDTVEVSDGPPAPEPSTARPERQVAEAAKCWLSTLARHFL